MYTYPPRPAKVAADLETVEIHRLLKSPTLISKRLADVLTGKFIADFLLPQRFNAEGGSILYETGEGVFPEGNPEVIQPGGEYPIVRMPGGALTAAHTSKRGYDAFVTDEAISRLGIDPVDRSLTKLANGMVRTIDTIAMEVLAAAATTTVAVAATSPATPDVDTGAWSAAANVVKGVLSVKAFLAEKYPEESFDFSTIVLKPTHFATVAGLLMASDMLPRESQNAVLSGVIQDPMGLTWVTSPYLTNSHPLIMDRDQIGGMANENIASPGYIQGESGLETKVMRDDDNDRYRLRARRVTVPVVLEPKAVAKITGTGLA